MRNQKITIPAAAYLVDCSAECVRKYIREGKLKSKSLTLDGHPTRYLDLTDLLNHWKITTLHGDMDKRMKRLLAHTIKRVDVGPEGDDQQVDLLTLGEVCERGE